MLTHGNLMANLAQAGHARPDDASLGVVPLHHIFGLNAVLGPALHAGARVVLVERFDPASARDTVRRRGVTLIAGPPSMWAAFAALPDVTPEQFAAVRVAASGGAALAPATRRLVEERLGLAVVEGYGLTEAGPAVTSAMGLAPEGDAPAGTAPPGSIGKPVPGVEVRVVGDDGRDVGPGEQGEIWVRGPNVFAGYWGDPETTAAALTPDGWLRTGDVGRADEGGWYYLLDRIKDLVIVSGINVYPGEVEAVLLEHPGVAAAAVVAVPHPHTGEAVKAFVVPERGGSIEEDDVVNFCRQRLAAYKCPTKVEFLDQLPEGVTGKVLRRELRIA
jgi:long-chain acyl-CoA synthetase